VRDQKRLLSLNEIWRFLSQEIDKRKLIEEKLILIEAREMESSGSDEEEIKQSPAQQKDVQVRSTTQV